MTQLLKGVNYWFLGLCVFSIPFSFHVFSFQIEISNTVFSKPSAWIVENIFGWKIVNPEITSDSATMYGSLGVLLMLAFFITTVFSFVSQKNKNKVFTILSVLFFYYLSMQLLKYGLDKIFKWQFYLPEPNTLYTPLGKLDKDLLFWSTMGTSRAYNIFMGMLEVVPAIFLLFRKTRPLGLLIAIPVLMNVVAINFCFDISVKIYSVFLLLLAVFLFIPYLKSLYQFFIKKENTKLPSEPILFSKNTFLRISLKTFIIGLIFLEALFPYFSTGNFNDDKTARPFLHGAYEVVEIIPKDSLQKHFPSIKRFFIHRNGYLIFQNEKDEMQDLKLEIDQAANEFELTDYQGVITQLGYDFNSVDTLLELQFFYNRNEYVLSGKMLEWKQLPALQDQFHWTVDE